MAQQVKGKKDSKPGLSKDTSDGLIQEMKTMEYEPLLPVEKKLIGWSIGLGIVSLAFLVWISYTFFPSGH